MWKMDHIAFAVSDMEAAISFYRDTLGLELLSDTVDQKHGERFAFLKLEGGNLELLQPLEETNRSAPRTVSPTSSLCPHLAIGVEDLDLLMNRLAGAGVSLLQGPHLIDDRVRWLYIADPDGNIIEFVQWLKS